MFAHLSARNVNSVFHYLPLHLSIMGRRFGGKEGGCPVTEDVSDRLLRLPFYNDLTEADQARVVSGITNFERGRASSYLEPADHISKPIGKSG